MLGMLGLYNEKKRRQKSVKRDFQWNYNCGLSSFLYLNNNAILQLSHMMHLEVYYFITLVIIL